MRQVVAALSLCVAVIPAHQAGAVTISSSEIVRSVRSAAGADAEVGAFYRARDYRPLWLDGANLLPEAARIVELVGNAAADGLDPAAYGAQDLADAVAAAGQGSPQALARAELMLSRALAAYARDLRRPTNLEIVYVDRELAPRELSPRETLTAVAESPSLASGIDEVTRMNPLYTGLRNAALSFRGSGRQAQLVRANLERARALPAEMGRRYILVDAASARLWMYEDGRVQGTMRVVVGRPGEQTPMMAGYIRHLTLNPYWNVPPDLVQRLIAPQVVRRGLSYLRTAGYEVLSGWGPDAAAIDPSTVDWAAVAAGGIELPVRQLPGPANSMGQVKFMFPNQRGVYLHDTPNRALFSANDRRQSAGCVRVEDADRLARWLFGRTVRPEGSAAEQNVALPEPVPVYITYLTALPEGGRITFQDDVYGRDRHLLARVGGTSLAARR